MLRWIGCLCVLVLASCWSETNTLVVQVRTDLVPGIELVRVETTVTPAGGGVPIRLMVDAGSRTGWAMGVRVAEVEDLLAGEVRLQVRAIGPGGVTLVERPGVVHLVSGVEVVTFLLTRECAGVECPLMGDDPTAAACLGGRCVPEDCTEETPDLCNPGDGCGDDGDCPPSPEACVSTECTESGTCFDSPRDDRCEDDLICDPARGCVPIVAVECGLCGDADGNGVTSVTDLVQIGDAVVSPPGSAPCLDPFADVLRDGSLTRRDLDAAAMLVVLRTGDVLPPGACEPCARSCGDVDGDRFVNSADLGQLMSFLSSPPSDLCVRWAADTEPDGTIDVSDVEALTRILEEGGSGCSP